MEENSSALETAEMFDPKGERRVVNASDVSAFKLKGWTIEGEESTAPPDDESDEEPEDEAVDPFDQDEAGRTLAFEAFKLKELQGMFSEALAQELVDDSARSKWGRKEYVQALAASKYKPEIIY